MRMREWRRIWAMGALAGVALLGCPCVLIDGEGDPTIAFTRVPERGSFGDVHGRVAHVEPCAYSVAVYIYVETSGWWTKPTFANPLTPISYDGTWSTDITTGGNDEDATKIAAFLIPEDCTPPALSGATGFPPDLEECAVAHVAVDRTAEPHTRLLYFSGYEWWVKTGTSLGPGPNTYSDSVENVWVDGDGQLHLRITKKESGFECAEVVSSMSFGYGTYTFGLASPVDQLNENVVLGLFTWNDDPAYYYREMDIEFSRWGDPAAENAQFVRQPWDWEDHIERFSIGPQAPTCHSITWQTDALDFASRRGVCDGSQTTDEEIHAWTFDGANIPVPGGDTNARMNLWLMWGEPPTDGQETEVVVNRFEFSAPE